MKKQPSAAFLHQKMRRDTESTIRTIQPGMKETKNIQDLSKAIRTEIQAVKLLQTKTNKIRPNINTKK